MKNLKIFKFKKITPTDLTDSPEFACDAIEVGRNRFTLKDFKLQEGHDDSIPYTAILYMNDKPVCKCFNDGWGGITELTALDATSKALMASSVITVGKCKWSYRGTEFDLTLDFIADTLACGAANKTERVGK